MIWYCGFLVRFYREEPLRLGLSGLGLRIVIGIHRQSAVFWALAAWWVSVGFVISVHSLPVVSVRQGILSVIYVLDLPTRDVSGYFGVSIQECRVGDISLPSGCEGMRGLIPSRCRQDGRAHVI